MTVMADLSSSRRTSTSVMRERDREPWHQLQDWLAAMPADVDVPFAADLARAIPSVAVRLRRDFPTLVTLVKAHALLQQCSRDTDDHGRVVATLEDYGIVRELVADLIADAAERAVPDTVRQTVEAVLELAKDDLLGDGVTGTQVAAHLGIDKSSALRRIRVAIARGFVRNLQERRSRPARLVEGDALPKDRALLPSVDELERLHGCTPQVGDKQEAQPPYPDGEWDLEAVDRGEPVPTLVIDGPWVPV
jgi:hypothetical protein